MTNIHRYARDGDNLSTSSSLRMTTSIDNNDHHFTMMTDEQFNNSVSDSSATNNADEIIVEQTTDDDDAVTIESMQAVTKERHQIHKENAAKLQSILENIKHSTKVILREMDTYLQEAEEVEKTFIRCRANTQKECQRMEQVEPDVIAATQRFMAQGSQFFGGMGGAMNFMNMSSLMGSGGGDSMAMTSFSPAVGNGEALMTTATVTPRENNGPSRP